MKHKNIVLAILIALLFSSAFSGCITKNYVDSSGQKCQKKYKFFILFIKSSYSCQPNSGAAS